ncbi:MAG: thioredoxin domain-containing protein [Chlamydiota bacterium]|nr:thioredoxin domain-containing protein [Chlamydiota bacterium]
MKKTYSTFYYICGAILVMVLSTLIFIVRDVQDDPRIVLDVSRIKGPINAPVHITEFSDFQCPACSKGADIMHRLMEKYPYKIRISFNHFPLRMHPWAMIAHICAQCAAEQGEYWPYHDLLFKYQKDWSTSKDPVLFFKEYAKKLNLDQNKFSSCVDTRATEPVVVADAQKGRDEHINRTPTFIVNGERIIGGDGLEERLDAQIRKILRLKEES